MLDGAACGISPMHAAPVSETAKPPWMLGSHTTARSAPLGVVSSQGSKNIGERKGDMGLGFEPAAVFLPSGTI